jgi:hypothetical protein
VPEKLALLRLLDRVASADSLSAVFTHALDCLQRKRSSEVAFDLIRS